MRPTRFALCVAITVALFATTVQAAPLAPGGLLHPMPGEADPVGGVVLATTVEPFVSATYSGTLTSTVYSGDTSNPFPGGLTFTYVLSNAAGTHSINRMSINGFDGFSLDASYETPAPAGAIVPAYVDREALGSTIGFSFVAAPVGSGALSPGATSATMVVQSNATTWVENSAFVLDGFPAATTALVPIPEPSTIVLAVAGLALVAFRCSRNPRRVAE